MEYKYGKNSSKNIENVHPLLSLIAYSVLETDDHAILSGGRSWVEQQAAFDSGASKLAPPKGKHLIQLDGFSYAIDVVPYLNGKPLATNEASFGPAQQAQFAWFLRKFYENGKTILAKANQQTPPNQYWYLRFGINWDSDSIILTDQNFQDWFHIELVKGFYA